MNEGLRWGAFVPQGWKLEFTGMDGVEAWDRAAAVAGLAERLGYDHLWVYDHVECVPRREPEPMFEAWTMMAALATTTTRAELGQLVTCAAYRNPGMLAKQAASASGGGGPDFLGGVQDKPVDVVGELQIELADYCCRRKAGGFFWPGSRSRVSPGRKLPAGSPMCPMPTRRPSPIPPWRSS